MGSRVFGLLIEADFYLPDWEMGQRAKQMMPANTTYYLSPNQAEMATIYFALGDEHKQLSSFEGEGDLLPLGIAGNPALYLIRPDNIQTLSRLRQQFPQGYTMRRHQNFAPFIVPFVVPRLDETVIPVQIDFGQQIRLVGYTIDQTPDTVHVTLY